MDEETVSTTGDVKLDITPEPSNADLLARVADLEAKLNATADVGRLLNYESSKQGKKPMRVNISQYDGGFIIGWRNVVDKLIKHPTTGRTVGEEQQYEILVLMPDGKIEKKPLDSYPAFSDARYTSRSEVEVVGKKEDWDGKVTFSIKLPDGREIDLDSRFIN